jgi:hypothetical protein
MQIIDQLRVPRGRGTRHDAVIQLLAGDLAAIPAEHAVDALVVSAFPNSYTPNEGTLFESLYERGLDMRQVALRKQEDERNRLGCWLSEPLPEDITARFHFKRIICFEPQQPEFLENSGIEEGNIEDAVGFVFRCLNNFIIPDGSDRRRYEISSVAMPLLATGNQGVPLDRMFPRLLEAAVFWLEQGLPVDQLKIVAFTPVEAAVATRIFQEAKSREHRRRKGDHDAGGVASEIDWEARLVDTLSREVIQTCTRNLRQSLVTAALDDEKPLLQRLFDRMDRGAPQRADSAAAGGGTGTEDYDVFVSYAHTQDQEVKELVHALHQRVPRPKVFFDRTTIPAGGQWIKMISDAVQKAGTFIAVLSPDYTASPVCWDEFQCAKLKEYNTRQSVIKTVRLYSETNLPPIMGIYSYIDCAEGDLQKLRQSAAAIVQ